MRPPVLPLALLALLVPGCLSPALDPDAAAVAPARDEALTWALQRCTFVIVSIPADAGAVRARLPEGFTLRPGALDPLRASLELDAYRCERGRWNGTWIDDMSYGSAYVPVTPPAALQEEGYEAAFVKWAPLVADDAARATMRAWGIDAREGDARVAIEGPLVTASLGLDDGGFALTGTLAGATTPVEELHFVEFTPTAEGGLARWHARLHDASYASGQGVVTLAPGWIRDAVGSESAPATFIAGAWNVDEADVAPLAIPR